jgi:hypothetical protein
MNSLEQRISKMERSLKLYRALFGSATIVLIAFVLMSSGAKTSAPAVVQAKKFELVDDYGNVLGSFYKEKGSGVLTTYSSSGTKQVSLIAIDGGGGGINTFDEAGTPIIKMTKTIGGGGYFAIYNKSSTEIAEMGATDANSGYFRINDKDGSKLAWITYTEGGGGYFSLSNGGTESIRLSTPSVGGRIGVYNGDGKRVIYAGAQDDETGNISAYDRSENYINGFGK